MRMMILILLMICCLALPAQIATAAPMPTGDLTALLANPATVIATDPVTDEPLNPAGAATGFNIAKVAVLRWDSNDAIEIGLVTATVCGDADGDGSALTTAYPWLGSNIPGIYVPEFGSDIPYPEKFGYEKDYFIMVIRGNSTLGFHWRDEVAGPPIFECRAWTGTQSVVIHTAWCAPFPPMPPQYTQPHFVATGLRAVLGDQVDLPALVYVMSRAGNRSWSPYDHMDMAMLQEPPTPSTVRK